MTFWAAYCPPDSCLIDDSRRGRTSLECATCPPHTKTIERLDHCSRTSEIGISPEIVRNFENQLARGSSDHCSTS